MRIVTKLSDCAVKVCGSISSANAAAFEQELLAAVSGQDLTIDAEELAYISSAGLRVLLKAKKALSGKLVMENVNAEVFDILDMTGFTQILTVRKALRQVSVEGLTEIGHGQNGHVYRMDPDTIVKVFRENIDYSMVQNEIDKAKEAFMLGIPTAISYDVVKVGPCFGVVYELLNARDLADCIKEAEEGEHPYVYDRHAERRKRERGEIGLHAVRGGTIVGEHDVLFAGKDEVITLSHSATSREVFATGAMRAAHFMCGRGPGFYNMDDVINAL